MKVEPGATQSCIQDCVRTIVKTIETVLAEWSEARVEEYVEGIDLLANAGVTSRGMLVPFTPTVRYPTGGC